jgi:flavin-dependent dehydrogenase
MQLAGESTAVHKGQAVAMRYYVRSSLPLDRLIFAYDRTTAPGYAWIAPMRNGEFNVGCGMPQPLHRSRSVNLRARLDRFVEEFPIARELLQRGQCGEIVSPLRGALLRCGLHGPKTAHGDRVLVIGETAGATYPFTGEGIGKAMETAELAAELVHRALATGELRLLQQFPTIVEQRFRDRFAGYAAAERWLSWPWLNDLVMRRVRRSKYLQRAFAGLVDESVDPRSIFSVRGLLRSVWS